MGKFAGMPNTSANARRRRNRKYNEFMQKNPETVIRKEHDQKAKQMLKR